MRFAELPVGGVSVRGMWAHWEELRLTLPQSPDNAKLMLAVPELDWNIDADAVELWADLLDVPTVKDATWTGVWSFWERVPGPLAMWRAWQLVRPRMRETDWSPTTAAGFSGRMVALKADVPATESDGFNLLGSDFVRLYDGFNFTIEHRWVAAEVVILQWLSGL
eukprot:7384699-Prymnesium_polylepis.1